MRSQYLPTKERGEILRCVGPAIYWLFILTRHVRVPVHERTAGVIAPCPDMQFKQPRQGVAVRRAYVLQQLTFEYRRSLLVRRQPVVGESDVLHADQLH